MSDGDERVFYAVAEGNREKGLSPAILRFEVRGKRLVKTGSVILADYAPRLLDPAAMGAHHADFHPDGVFFRIDLETLEVSDRLYLGGNVLMGSFIWNGDGVNM